MRPDNVVCGDFSLPQHPLLGTVEPTAATRHDIDESLRRLSPHYGHRRMRHRSRATRRAVNLGCTLSQRVAIAVMDEDRSGSSQHIIRVKVIDGEVVGGVMSPRDWLDTCDSERGTITGCELISGVERIRALPLFVGGVVARQTLWQDD